MSNKGNTATLAIDAQLALVESKTLRSQHMDRLDALERVGTLAMVPNNEFATVKQVAAFYNVPQKTVESVVEDNRAELEDGGYVVLRGKSVAPLRGAADLSPKARSLAVFPRRAVLLVGMLLRDSAVAKRVRAYLLNVEEAAAPEQREQAVDLLRLQERCDYRNVIRALAMGGATSDGYRLVQQSIYVGLFGKTAGEVRSTQPQRTGTPRSRGEGFRKSTVAKDFLTQDQMDLLNNVVLAMIAQLNRRFPLGATTAEMLGVAQRAISLLQVDAA